MSTLQFRISCLITTMPHITFYLSFGNLTIYLEKKKTRWQICLFSLPVCLTTCWAYEEKMYINHGNKQNLYPIDKSANSMLYPIQTLWEWNVLFQVFTYYLNMNASLLCKYNTQRFLIPGDLNWVQHWVSRLGLWSFFTSQKSVSYLNRSLELFMFPQECFSFDQRCSQVGASVKHGFAISNPSDNLWKIPFVKVSNENARKFPTIDIWARFLRADLHSTIFGERDKNRTV